MTIKKILPIVLAVATVLSSSCAKEEPVVADEELVIDGWIESGANPRVFITTAIPATSEAQSAADLESHLVRYAKVTIEHDGKEYPLVSSISDYYYIKTYFTTSDIVGTVGETYTLKVEYKDKKAVATTTVPAPAQLDSLWCEPAGQDSTRVIMASFHDNPLTKDYYRFFTWIRNRENYYCPAYLGLMDDSASGDVITIQVDPGTHLPNFTSDKHYYVGDIVSVKFATTTSEVYEFWSKVDQNNIVSYLPFNISGVNVYGNVDGALGCWAGYGINEYTICVD